ncbi:2-phosphosulfolactate phosphatase [Bacillus salitolerans]|uniref:Probable 2-phosphosulfolactate phosphatase n=1 Tax=Bacillus salitolerans TaxID=1437434 RepID=A0ABW4LQA5_9BACI
MRKVHLLLKKEEIDHDRISIDKIVVVFDILLATSTIASALEYGAKRVIPVLDVTEAKYMTTRLKDEDYVLVGEYQGVTIDGFLSPNPLQLKDQINGKTVILSTTNGTVAIKNSAGAKIVYAASILNSQAIVSHLLRCYPSNETIVLVCAGSSGMFNIEDFYGAGYFIDCLLKVSSRRLQLTDSSYAAHRLYRGNQQLGSSILRNSRIGTKLTMYGYEKEVQFVTRESVLSNVPILNDQNHIVCAMKLD